MATTKLEANDVRQTERTDVLKGASIIGKNLNDRCIVTNMSEDGAELELAADVRVPDLFELHLPKADHAQRCEVRWRDKGRVGVAFLGTKPKQPHRLSIVKS